MNMSKELKTDWLPKLQVRYCRRNREGKSRMLDEMCEDYEYERKYAIKLLCGGLPPPSGRVHPGPEPQYELIEPVVRQVWAPWQNFFLPCLKLEQKWRQGSRWHKHYEVPRTAYDRLCAPGMLSRSEE